MGIFRFIFELFFGLLSWGAITLSTIIVGIASLNYLKAISANPMPEIADAVFTICIFITAANISAFIYKNMYFSKYKED